ncbi:MAG: MBL fold metallo-hydrolase [Erythrobacter sp.]
MQAMLKLLGAPLILAAAAGCSDWDSTAAAGNVAAQTQANPAGIGSAACPSEGAVLQVLGSGGPIAEADRAGTSYLLWIEGEPRLLIDAGPGSFLRFAQAGGKVSSLDAILLTHLHGDHAGGLAGILNTGGFEGGGQPLLVYGPDDAERFPATSEFLDRLLSKEGGAFAYLGGYDDGSENKRELLVTDITTDQGAGAPVGLDISNDYSVIAYPVNHAAAPALGYAIEVGDTSFVITGDQNAQSERFANELSGSKPTVLFAHHVINGDPGQPRGLHRTPAEIGELAGRLEPETLVLTHNMNRSLNRIDDSRAAIRQNFEGPLEIAADLDCFAL